MSDRIFRGYLLHIEAAKKPVELMSEERAFFQFRCNYFE